MRVRGAEVRDWERRWTARADADVAQTYFAQLTGFEWCWRPLLWRRRIRGEAPVAAAAAAAACRHASRIRAAVEYGRVLYEGDWFCGSCGAQNYGDKERCFRCGVKGLRGGLGECGSVLCSCAGAAGGRLVESSAMQDTSYRFKVGWADTTLCITSLSWICDRHHSSSAFIPDPRCCAGALPRPAPRESQL